MHKTVIFLLAISKSGILVWEIYFWTLLNKLYIYVEVFKEPYLFKESLNFKARRTYKNYPY